MKARAIVPSLGWWMACLLAALSLVFVASEETTTSDNNNNEDDNTSCVDLGDRLANLYNSSACALAVAMVSTGDLFALGNDADPVTRDAVCDQPPSCVNRVNRMAERLASRACPFSGDPALWDFYRTVQGQQADVAAVTGAYCQAGALPGSCYASVAGVPASCGRTGFADDGDEWTVGCFATAECGGCLASWVDLWEGLSPSFAASVSIPPPAVLELAREAAGNESLCTEPVDPSSSASTTSLHRVRWWWGLLPTAILLSPAAAMF